MRPSEAWRNWSMGRDRMQPSWIDVDEFAVDEQLVFAISESYVDWNGGSVG
jgi:hypothetical protein